jgi:RNA polymerase sigma factor (sigma-70 family)
MKHCSRELVPEIRTPWRPCLAAISPGSNIAIRMLYHHADAEDAAQEILIEVLKSLPSFRGDSKFSTWLYRTAVNHILNMKKEKWATSEAICSFAVAAAGLQRVPDFELSQQPG